MFRPHASEQVMILINNKSSKACNDLTVILFGGVMWMYNLRGPLSFYGFLRETGALRRIFKDHHKYIY